MRFLCHFQRIWRFFFQRRELRFMDNFPKASYSLFILPVINSLSNLGSFKKLLYLFGRAAERLLKWKPTPRDMAGYTFIVQSGGLGGGSGFQVIFEPPIPIEVPSAEGMDPLPDYSYVGPTAYNVAEHARLTASHLEAQGNNVVVKVSLPPWADSVLVTQMLSRWIVQNGHR